MLKTLIRTTCEFKSLPPSYYLNKVESDQHARPLKAGGFGDVYKGSWRGECVALKVVRGMFSEKSGEWLNPCIKEIVVWRQLNHAIGIRIVQSLLSQRQAASLPASVMLPFPFMQCTLA